MDIHICILVRANIDSLNVKYNLRTIIPATQKLPILYMKKNGVQRYLCNAWSGCKHNDDAMKPIVLTKIVAIHRIKYMVLMVDCI